MSDSTVNNPISFLRFTRILGNLFASQVRAGGDVRDPSLKGDEVVLSDAKYKPTVAKDKLLDISKSLVNVPGDNQVLLRISNDLKLLSEKMDLVVENGKEVLIVNESHRGGIYKAYSELKGLAGADSGLEKQLSPIILDLRNTTVGTRYYLKIIEEIQPYFKFDEQELKNALGGKIAELIKFSALIDEKKVEDAVAKAQYIVLISSFKNFISDTRINENLKSALIGLTNTLILDATQFFPKLLTDEDNEVLTLIKTSPPANAAPKPEVKLEIGTNLEDNKLKVLNRAVTNLENLNLLSKEKLNTIFKDFKDLVGTFKSHGVTNNRIKELRGFLTDRIKTIEIKEDNSDSDAVLKTMAMNLLLNKIIMDVDLFLESLKSNSEVKK